MEDIFSIEDFFRKRDIDKRRINWFAVGIYSDLRKCYPEGTSIILYGGDPVIENFLKNEIQEICKKENYPINIDLGERIKRGVYSVNVGAFSFKKVRTFNN